MINAASEESGTDAVNLLAVRMRRFSLQAVNSRSFSSGKFLGRFVVENNEHRTESKQRIHNGHEGHRRRDERARSPASGASSTGAWAARSRPCGINLYNT